jgi:Prp8 binding protein
VLWNVFGECQSYLLLKGHKNAVVQALWSHDDSQIVSGSSDTTLGVWDATSGKRLLKLAEHESFINAISLGQKDVHRIASVGDDSVSYLWDDRSKKSAQMIQQRYPLTSVALLDERNLLFTGGIDNIISAWDIRKTSAPAWTLKGHSETISSLCVDPEGSFLLSSSMDNTLRIWDVRAFAPDQRCIRIIGGVTHGIDKALIRCNWSSDGGLVASGSSDKNVYIFDSLSGSIKYCLPGHTGTVTEVDFHPKQPIVASASADKRIFLGELQEA